MARPLLQMAEITLTLDQQQDYKVLVIAADTELLRLVQQGFLGTAITVYTAENGRNGLRQLYAHHPDLILLDSKVPHIDDQPLLAIIQEITNTPVILLVERDALDEVISALDRGAIDDYITIPIPLKLLVAHVKAFLRKRSRTVVLPSITYADAYLLVDSYTQRVLVNGQPVHLTAAERKLLFYLAARVDHVCNYAELLEHTWGWEYRDSTQYVHVYISRLRRKIEPDPKRPRYLRTIHGIGYQFQK
jgi:two-component system, OmpR family, KDP operon response regulator KdpE